MTLYNVQCDQPAAHLGRFQERKPRSEPLPEAICLRCWPDAAPPWPLGEAAPR